ncbi:MAG: TonB family protein [Rhodothermales bacterium]|nr:TonB family protein [Rhodothermales bacterium]
MPRFAPPRTALVLVLIGLAGCAGGRELNTFGPPEPPPGQRVSGASLAPFSNPCAPPLSEAAAPSDSLAGPVDQPPELIGGLEGLTRQVRYPELARRAGIEGTVCLQFVVDEDGGVRDVEVVRSAHRLLDEEAVRAVRAAAFRPGVQDGEPVAVRFTLPVAFRLRGGGPSVVGTLLGVGALLGAITVYALLMGPPE